MYANYMYANYIETLKAIDGNDGQGEASYQSRVIQRQEERSVPFLFFPFY